MTGCSETLFPFEAHFSRQVAAQFERSWLTTEAHRGFLSWVVFALFNGILICRGPAFGAPIFGIDRQ
jgi:hypothetical protein